MEEFKSEKEKMIAGALYFASDPELVADRKKAREQMALINQQPDTYIRRQLIEETFGKVGVGTYIEPLIMATTFLWEKISMPILITFF